MTPKEAKALALVAVGRQEAKSAVDNQRRDELRRSFMTDAEAEELILGIMRVRGTQGANEDEVTALINECISARFMASCVDLAVKGLLDVDYDPTQPVGDRLVFKYRKDLDATIKDVLQRRRGDG